MGGVYNKLMTLPPEDAELFFDLMFSLHVFVNGQLEIIPDVTTLEAYRDLPRDQKMQVRKALYEHSDLIDAYLQTNPHNFSSEHLAIVESWKHFVAGDFYIERALKKHAIFIGDNEVYAVLALYDSFKDMFGNYFPLYIKTVLLPFKGKIIYDGLLEFYNISFGSGISDDLKESYMRAKQNKRIIETFETKANRGKGKANKPVKNWLPELDALAESASKLRSSKNASALQGPVFRLVKASLALARASERNPEDLDGLWKLVEKTDRALERVATTLNRFDD